MNIGHEHLVDGKYSFRDLVDLEQLQNLFESFSQASGYTTGLVSFPDQELLFGTGWRDICTKFHRVFPNSEIYCKKSNMMLTSCLKEHKMLNICHCESGLVDGATPIIIRGVHVANLATGQILFKEPDIEYFRKQGEEYGYDVEAYLEALKEVPVVSEEAFKKVMTFLSEMAVMLAEQGLAKLQKQEVLHQVQKSEENMRITLNSIGDAVITTDTEGVIVRMNPVASKLTGWKLEDAKGKYLNDVFNIISSETRKSSENPVERVLATGDIIGLANHTSLISKSGIEYQIADSAAPIKDDENNIVGVVLVFRDETEKYMIRKELKETAHFMNNVIESVQDGISIINPDLTVSYVNDVMKRWYSEGIPLEGKKCFKCYHNTEIPCDPCPTLRCFESGKMQKEIVCGFPGSEEIWLEIFCYPIKDVKTDEITSVAEFVRNITERRQAEDSLRDSEEKFREIIENASDAIFITDPTSGIIIDTNKKAEKLVGLPVDDIIGMFQMDLHPKEDADKYKRIFLNQLKNGGGLAIDETYIYNRNGYNIPVEINASVVNISKKKYMLGLFRDIRERKLAEEALRESENRYRDLFVQSADAFLIIKDKKFVDCNPATLRMLGYKNKTELLTCHPSKLSAEFQPDGRCSDEKADEMMSIAYKRGSHRFEWAHKRFNGEVFPVEVLLTAIPSKDGAYLHVVWRDLTEEKRAEEALNKSEICYQTLFESANDSIFLMTDEIFIDCNQKTLEIFGCSRSDIIEHSPVEFSPPVQPDGRKSEEKSIEKINATFNGIPQVFEWKHKKLDGTLFDAEVSLNLVKLSTGVFLQAIVRDITERKQVEQDLTNLQNYLSNIIDSMPSILMGVDINGVITQWNREACRITGITSQDAIGCQLEEVFPCTSLNRERVNEAMKTSQTLYIPRQHCIEDGETHYKEITVYPLTGKDVDGAVIRIDDVTEQVKIQELMIQSEKMMSVGGLAAGMAHEINNPLAGMLQTASVLNDRLTNLDLPPNQKAATEIGTTMDKINSFMNLRDVPQMLERINDSGRRVAEIVMNMLSLARKSDFTFIKYDLSELLDEAVELSSNDYNIKRQYDFRQFKIIREFEDNLPLIPCESSKIQQVLLNVLRNGAEAMQGDLNKDGVETPCFILRLALEKDNDMIRLEIEDTGHGMSGSIRKRVFEPFFTTKSTDQGTGLGLSVSYFIITENHGGLMSVESEPGHGTKFIIRLPLEREEV
ncbi:PAS domain S-box protein [bacterium]|nr:PAS domain S-box protein [bacterium]